MMAISVRARWLLTLDSPPIEGGVVTIDGERIVEIGTTANTQTLDLGDVVLLPGLVNAHTHLEFSDCLKPLGKPGMPLPEWIRQVIGTRHRADRDPGEAIQQGLAESLRSGVTAIAEISTASAGHYRRFTGSHLQVYQEVIGFSAARIDSVYGDLEVRVDAACEYSLDVGISPHAPYTVHSALLQQMVDMAAVENLPVAMHLAESREELELLANGSGPFQQLLDDRSMWDAEAIPIGSTPLDYLRVLSEAPITLVIHGNYLSNSEIDYLAKHRDKMSVVYCPRTHEFFRHEPYPLLKMLEQGVRVVLGTDSRASNPDLNLLSELRFVAQKFPSIAPEQLLRMITRDAAESLGHANTIGTISPGKYADMIAIGCDALTDPWSAIFNGDILPSCVLVRGQRLTD